MKVRCTLGVSLCLQFTSLGGMLEEKESLNVANGKTTEKSTQKIILKKNSRREREKSDEEVRIGLESRDENLKFKNLRFFLLI